MLMKSYSQVTSRGHFMTSLWSESEFLQTVVGRVKIPQEESQVELPRKRLAIAHPG